ncbi:MAG: hypothetical protein MK160_02450 [Rhodobacteraceae bacterium]|nr:hypothetical protein [Paracoccaceae bacterium]
MKRFLALLALVLLIEPAHAAEIERKRDDFMGCIATLSGPIVKGDADKLEAMLPDLRLDVAAALTELYGYTWDAPASVQFDGFRLCLNSPGGSLSEAIRMGDILHAYAIGTAVARDADCQSA